MAKTTGEISLREVLAREADDAAGAAAKLRVELAAERKRSALLSAQLAADIKRLAKEHNARFDREHGAS